MSELRNLLLSANVTLLAAKKYESGIPEREWLYEIAAAAAAGVVFHGEGEETSMVGVIPAYLEGDHEIGAPPDAKARDLLERVIVYFHGLTFLLPESKRPYLFLIRNIANTILTGDFAAMAAGFEATEDDAAELVIH
jgi:uncharacterized protein with NAD-binding domain and iron-sulfur cluster